MATPRKAAAAPKPQFVRHSKRPEWGVGRIADVYAGRLRVQFADGVLREFRADVLEAVADADVPPEVLAAPATPPPSAASGARKSTAPAARKSLAPATRKAAAPAAAHKDAATPRPRKAAARSRPI